MTVQTVFIQEAPTKLQGSAFNLDQGQYRTFPGGILGRHRKQIVITNDANSDKLHIMTQPGGTADGAKKMMTIFPNSSITLFTNDEVTLQAVDARLGPPGDVDPCITVIEIFYTGAGNLVV